MFILDTDHISILQRASGPDADRLDNRMTVHGGPFFVTLISFQEQVSGWNAYLNRAKTRAEIVKAYDRLGNIQHDYCSMNVLSFDEDAFDQFEELRRSGVRIGTMDLRIAAIALAQHFTLLSRNFADFALVPGLNVEDWTKP